MATLNFTKTALKSLPSPETGRAYYNDDPVKGVRGLGLTVTSSGSKTYHVRATVQGRTKRISIPGGKFPDMAIDTARRKALELLAKIADGVDPIAQRKRAKASEVTLKAVFDQYTTTKKLKPATLEKYRASLLLHFADYWDRPLIKITESVAQDINARHKQKAAGTLRVLKALFNFARHQYKAENESLFPKNPVDILSEQKVTHRYGRKKSYIRAKELPSWFDSVERLPTVDKEYLLFLLLTGTRADSEAAALTWDKLNWTTKTFHLSDTKNHEDVELPLPAYLVPMLKRRRELDGLIFPIESECRASREQVTRETGIKFSRHDLRRTFLTIGESEDISFLALKRLSNHKSQETDVTAGYVVVSQERLRQASEKLEMAILKHANRLDAEVLRIVK